jgi:hypothetical protein
MHFVLIFALFSQGNDEIIQVNTQRFPTMAECEQVVQDYRDMFLTLVKKHHSSTYYVECIEKN